MRVQMIVFCDRKTDAQAVGLERRNVLTVTDEENAGCGGIYWDV